MPARRLSLGQGGSRRVAPHLQEPSGPAPPTQGKAPPQGKKMPALEMHLFVPRSSRASDWEGRLPPTLPSSLSGILTAHHLWEGVRTASSYLMSLPFST